MHLVDDQDDVAQGLDLLNEALHTALELAPELSARHHGGHVQQPDLLVLELIGHLATGDALGQTLGHGGFAHARLADKAGVVLLAAVEDLDDPQGLTVPAHHPVQLAGAGLGRQVHGIIVQKFLLFFGFFAGFARLFPDGLFLGLALAEQVEQGERRRAGGDFLLVAGLLVGGLCGRHPHLLYQSGQAVAQRFRGQAVQVAVLQAEFIQKIGHRLDAQFLGALEAQALVDGLSIFKFGDENHCHIFFAAGADRYIHVIPPNRDVGSDPGASPAADS